MNMRYLASVVTNCFQAFGELLALQKHFVELSGGVTRCAPPHLTLATWLASWLPGSGHAACMPDRQSVVWRALDTLQAAARPILSLQLTRASAPQQTLRHRPEPRTPSPAFFTLNPKPAYVQGRRDAGGGGQGGGGGPPAVRPSQPAPEQRRHHL